MTPPGIEPATFPFVVQHLNHCATAVPRAKDKHYKIKDWPMRENSVSGENCVRNLPLGDKVKILLLPLHITLGLTKNFVKTMNKRGKGLEYSREKFPNLSDGKLK